MNTLRNKLADNALTRIHDVGENFAKLAVGGAVVTGAIGAAVNSNSFAQGAAAGVVFGLLGFMGIAITMWPLAAAATTEPRNDIENAVTKGLVRIRSRKEGHVTIWEAYNSKEHEKPSAAIVIQRSTGFGVFTTRRLQRLEQNSNALANVVPT